MSEISDLRERYLVLINASNSNSELEEVRIRSLGKKGEIALNMRELATMTIEERQVQGPILNKLKEDINNLIKDRRECLEAEILSDRLNSEWLDVSRSTRLSDEGSIHPVSQVTEEVIAIFSGMGFQVADGPQIELSLIHI